jgi:Mn2+/Fe2+ NRAMP family transporter
MPDTTSDPYTIRQGEAHEPPTNFLSRIKYLGPSIITTGAVVGSGELILTSSLGAIAGFSLLWWIALSCWVKSLVQAEVARYTVTTGDTYLRAMNRVPGHFKNLSWPIWVGLIGFIPGTMGLGGILGAGGLALSFLSETINSGLAWMPTIGPVWASASIVVVTIAILGSGSYRWLERVMMVLVLGFTLTTLVCSIAMQFTEFSVSPLEMIAGFKFEFPLEFAALALAAYGYTGMAAGDIATYSYWCIEKGYPSFVGENRSDPNWPSNTRGWMKVLQTDVALTVIILTCATLPFYILGAGVLNPMGERPEGNPNEVISALSNMFTQTLGPWAVWIFAFGAFFILFSTVLSGIGGGGRFIPDYFIEAGAFKRSNLDARRAWTRGYVIVMPIIAFLMYIWIKNPVLLIMIGGLTSAVTMPIQTGCLLWLQATKMDQRIRPHAAVRVGLWAIFLFQFLMSWFVVWFVVLKPNLG